MARPREHTEARALLSFRLPPALLNAASVGAGARGISRNHLVEHAVAAHLAAIDSRATPWVPYTGQGLATMPVRLPLSLKHQLEVAAAAFSPPVAMARVVEAAVGYELGQITDDAEPYNWG